MEQVEVLKTESVEKTQVVKNLEIPLHTIIMMIGPSGAGKTTMCLDKIIPELEASVKGKKKLNIQYISSDGIRRELLGMPGIDNMDRVMNYASEQAFHVLNTKLRSAVSYPINADFVIVDTTGISSKFREDVAKVAKEHNYNMVGLAFDYKNRNEYVSKRDDSYVQKKVSHRHISTFKLNVLREINQRDFLFVERIKSRNFDAYSFSAKDCDEYVSRMLPPGEFYFCIGDIHGCYIEFISLLKHADFKIDENQKVTHPENQHVVLLGDYIDKNTDLEEIKKIIEFIHINLDTFYVLIGNHESFTYKWLKGYIDKKSAPPKEVLDTYFNTIALFERDEEIKQKFFEIFEKSKEFYTGRDFIATHAPCSNAHLGKLNQKALKAQRDFKYSRGKDFDTPELWQQKIDEEFAFLTKDAKFNYPFHIFGHVGVGSRVASLYNKFCIDTSCIDGGSLSAILITPSGYPIIKAVPSTRAKVKEVFPVIFNAQERVIDINTLESREKGRILYAAEDKVNFVSGTMSPADKDVEKNELETLDKAYEYYKSKSIDKVVLQNKWMGSRSNAYIFCDPSKNYATSRNGYKITHVDISKTFAPLYEIPYIKNKFENENGLMILLDAELLPWDVLGKSLISTSFVTFEKAVASELEFLKANGFEESLYDFYNGTYSYSSYEVVSANTSYEDLKKALGDNTVKQLKECKEFMNFYIPIKDMQENLKVFSKQLELYGQEGEPYFKPFAILKEVYKDGTEKLFFEESNEFMFNAVGTGESVTVDLNDAISMEAGREFYNRTTNDMQQEGVVIKPYKVYNRGVAPYLKVRNPRYLTIVFGPDYTHPKKYDKLLKRRNINRKLRTSINEFELGKKLLEIPYNSISKDNKQYLTLMAQMVLEERNEKMLDPRL